jgi:sugar O-acyltransferase (sialic acid O-acetyltransferase NeuD family)
MALCPQPRAERSCESTKTMRQHSIVRVVIIGAGGHARVIADAIHACEAKHRGIRLVGYLEDDRGHVGRKNLGKCVLGHIRDLTVTPHDAVVIGIGDNRIRRKLFRDLSTQGEKIMTVVHPQATVARDVKMGRGTVVFAGVVINSGASIGNNVILNTGCSVDHDCAVNSHAHICPGVHLGGGVRIGEGVLVGIGSSIVHNRTIGAWSEVGAGAGVIRDVPPRTEVIGVPAVAVRSRTVARQTDN